MGCAPKLRQRDAIPLESHYDIMKLPRSDDSFRGIFQAYQITHYVTGAHQYYSFAQAFPEDLQVKVSLIAKRVRSRSTPFQNSIRAADTSLKTYILTFKSDIHKSGMQTRHAQIKYAPSKRKPPENCCMPCYHNHQWFQHRMYILPAFPKQTRKS